MKRYVSLPAPPINASLPMPPINVSAPSRPKRLSVTRYPVECLEASLLNCVVSWSANYIFNHDTGIEDELKAVVHRVCRLRQINVNDASESRKVKRICSTCI